MQKNPIPMEWYVATLAALTVPLFVYGKIPIVGDLRHLGRLLPDRSDLREHEEALPDPDRRHYFRCYLFRVGLYARPNHGHGGAAQQHPRIRDDAGPALSCTDSGLWVGSGDILRLRLFRGSCPGRAGKHDTGAVRALDIRDHGAAAGTADGLGQRGAILAARSSAETAPESVAVPAEDLTSTS